MGHKKNFLCSFLILIFSSFIRKVNEVWAQKVQTNHHKDLLSHVKQQIKSTNLYDDK